MVKKYTKTFPEESLSSQQAEMAQSQCIASCCGASSPSQINTKPNFDFNVQVSACQKLRRKSEKFNQCNHRTSESTQKASLKTTEMIPNFSTEKTPNFQNPSNHTKNTVSKGLAGPTQQLYSAEVKRKRGRPRKEEMQTSEVALGSPQRPPAMELRIRNGKGTKQDENSDKVADGEVPGKTFRFAKVSAITSIDGPTDNRDQLQQFVRSQVSQQEGFQFDTKVSQQFQEQPDDGSNLEANEQMEFQNLSGISEVKFEAQILASSQKKDLGLNGVLDVEENDRLELNTLKNQLDLDVEASEMKLEGKETDSQVEYKVQDTQAAGAVSDITYVYVAPPKRPLSPYIFFSQEQRKILKSQHPNWSTKLVMKHLSKTWNRMSTEVKARYKILSDSDRSRFESQRNRHKECVKNLNQCTCEDLYQEQAKISKPKEHEQNYPKPLHTQTKKIKAGKLQGKQKGLNKNGVRVSQIRSKRQMQPQDEMYKNIRQMHNLMQAQMQQRSKRNQKNQKFQHTRNDSPFFTRADFDSNEIRQSSSEGFPGIGGTMMNLQATQQLMQQIPENRPQTGVPTSPTRLLLQDKLVWLQQNWLETQNQLQQRSGLSSFGHHIQQNPSQSPYMMGELSGDQYSQLQNLNVNNMYAGPGLNSSQNFPALENNTEGHENEFLLFQKTQRQSNFEANDVSNGIKSLQAPLNYQRASFSNRMQKDSRKNTFYDQPFQQIELCDVRQFNPQQLNTHRMISNQLPELPSQNGTSLFNELLTQTQNTHHHQHFQPTHEVVGYQIQVGGLNSISHGNIVPISYSNQQPQPQLWSQMQQFQQHHQQQFYQVSQNQLTTTQQIPNHSMQYRQAHQVQETKPVEVAKLD